MQAICFTVLCALLVVITSVEGKVDAAEVFLLTTMTDQTGASHSLHHMFYRSITSLCGVVYVSVPIC